MSVAHYLATEDGLKRFQLVLGAITLWRDALTPVQRRVLLADGGPCATITARRLEVLGLVTRDGKDVTVTDYGRFVTQANNPQLPNEGS